MTTLEQRYAEQRYYKKGVKVVTCQCCGRSISLPVRGRERLGSEDPGELVFLDLGRLDECWFVEYEEDEKVFLEGVVIAKTPSMAASIFEYRFEQNRYGGQERLMPVFGEEAEWVCKDCIPPLHLLGQATTPEAERPLRPIGY